MGDSGLVGTWWADCLYVGAVAVVLNVLWLATRFTPGPVLADAAGIFGGIMIGAGLAGGVQAGWKADTAELPKTT